jgi:hypothetical protein
VAKVQEVKTDKPTGTEQDICATGMLNYKVGE